jgi:predicted nucleotidyltransferase
MELTKTPHDFFKMHNIDCGAIIRHFGLESCPWVAIVGSVAEGKYNRESDFDLMIVGEFDSKNALVEEHSSYYKTINFRSKDFVDTGLDVVPKSTMQSIQEKLAKIHARNPIKLSREELLILNRLLFSIPLVGVVEFEIFKKSIDFDSYITSVCYSRLLYYLSLREDMIAFFDEGDIESSTWVAREAFRHLCGLILASYGKPSSKEKWYWYDLNKTSSSLGDDMLNTIGEYCCIRSISTDDQLKNTLKFMDEVIKKVCRNRPQVLQTLRFLKHAITYKEN